jgi:rfaE bifunctional protein kinase chain/domain
MPEAPDLEKLFKNFTRQKILIIGDVMIDSYLWGKVRRISPEAPVPVVSDIEGEIRLGGAANVALNIKAMGAVPILCSVIGNDMRGQEFLELLSEQNLSDVGIMIDEDRITTQKTRVISGNQHLLRVDEETDIPVRPRSEEKMLDFISSFIEDRNINSIIFQDYDKGVITPRMIDEVISQANSLKIPVLVDPKKRNFLNFKHTTLFKPNFKELTEGLKANISKRDISSIARAVRSLRKKGDHGMVMVTLSELGIMVCGNEGCHHISAEVRDIADVSGAGDTVISLAALSVGENLSGLHTALISNLAGGQVCVHPGVVPVNREQLLSESKIVMGDGMKQRVKKIG